MVNIKDLQALNLSGSYKEKNSNLATQSCVKPWQPAIYELPLDKSYQHDKYYNEYDDSHDCKGDGDSGNLATLQGRHSTDKVSNLKKVKNLM